MYTFVIIEFKSGSYGYAVTKIETTLDRFERI